MAAAVGPGAEHWTREVAQDRRGFWVVECACGWRTPPMPGLDVAVDDYGDHRAALVVQAAARRHGARR